MARILLVEDNEVNRVMLCRRLEQRGYQMTSAETGEECLELATAAPPDLILMDLGLPGIDGWETTRRLKANASTLFVPVIALSAHAHESDREHAITAGCVEFETKPVQLAVLVKKIEAALAVKSQTATPTSDDESIFGDLELPTNLSSPGSLTAILRIAPAPTQIEHDSCPIARKHILVVEDNDPNRVMLCRRLQKQGFQTTEARDGREALALARGGTPFDLMLLDIMMPEVDGYQVLSEMKGDPVLQTLPIIMISALDEMASVVKCIELGAEDYLQKPYDPVLLQARVNACLDKRRLRDQELEYLRAVADLTTAAAAVENGNFNTHALQAVAQREDELGRLARVFQKMAEQVRTREQTLRKEVQRLQVEIDEVRKTEQVAEITETSYFQQLQAKAFELRKRYRRNGEE